MSFTEQIPASFRSLPLRERLFVRARLLTAPLRALSERIPEEAQVADVGCGHGLLAALLAEGHPRRRVVGADPDARKIEWARRGPGSLPNVELRAATVGELADDLESVFDAVTVVDVLYLLPPTAWPGFLADCRRLLRPGGTLLLKEAEARRSWKYYKSFLQELFMVRVAGKTLSSGAVGFQPRTFHLAALEEAGFRVEDVVDLSSRYSTPHVLFVARNDDQAGVP